MIDINPFCGREETRPYLHTPFNHDGYTYATNGQILIRVAKRDGMGDRPSELRSFDGLIASLQLRWFDPDASFAPIPEFVLVKRPAKKCEICYGSGTCTCECCDHEHDCGRCDGSGTAIDERNIARFPEQDINLAYIELIRALPGVEIAFGKDNEPAVFRFEGGVGCIMPMRTRDLPADSDAAEAALA
jgi:hypothetical protein